ncbi:exported hypothetical protein [Bradyrhizobium sp. STM 3843]|nr:exported hypothetical protein [Bradyrhizobium sp. STM 3843]
MTVRSRRAVLGLVAQGVAASAAAGILGARFVETVQAMPMAPDLARTERQSDQLTPAQWWGAPPAPGWGRPPPPGWGRPPPRRRRWVCWWHRGRRRCGWR